MPGKGLKGNRIKMDDTTANNTNGQLRQNNRSRRGGQPNRQDSNQNGQSQGQNGGDKKSGVSCGAAVRAQKRTQIPGMLRNS